MGKDKNEIHRLAAATIGLFVSPPPTVTIYHIKDMLNGNKEKIYSKDVKHITVPYFDNLTVEDMLDFIANGYPKAVNSLPTRRKETLKMPRWYIADVIFT